MQESLISVSRIKYINWNLPDAERVDLIRRKLLKEHNIEFIEY